MAGAAPEEQVRLPLLRQRWDAIAFLNWRYEPPAVQRLLPPGLTVEEIDGSAWVSLVPFVARGTRPGLLPASAALPAFPQTNLRTYVRTPRGADALWLLSVEAASRAVAGAVRALGAPYHSAVMEAQVEPGRCRYVSRRRGSGVGHRIELRPGGLLEDGAVEERDHLLTGRWRAVVAEGRALLVVPVRHPPWALHRAEVVELQQDLTEAAGLPPPAAAPEVLWSPGVEAVFGVPRAA